MLDNSSWDLIADVITADDFFRRDHRLIYQAIEKLAVRGSKPLLFPKQGAAQADLRWIRDQVSALLCFALFGQATVNRVLDWSFTVFHRLHVHNCSCCLQE